MGTQKWTCDKVKSDLFTKFGFEVTKEECQRKCKCTWQYVCNYNKAEYKYRHVWLSEKTNMHIKNMLNSTLPRLYRYNIKYVFSKSIQITGREIFLILCTFWLIWHILGLIFLLTYLILQLLVPSVLNKCHMNTMHWDGTLIIWLKMSLKGKLMPTVFVLWVWVLSTDGRWY